MNMENQQISSFASRHRRLVQLMPCCICCAEGPSIAAAFAKHLDANGRDLNVAPVCHSCNSTLATKDRGTLWRSVALTLGWIIGSSNFGSEETEGEA
jgi:hypothetical protein